MDVPNIPSKPILTLQTPAIYRKSENITVRSSALLAFGSGCLAEDGRFLGTAAAETPPDVAIAKVAFGVDFERSDATDPTRCQRVRLNQLDPACPVRKPLPVTKSRLGNASESFEGVVSNRTY